MVRQLFMHYMYMKLYLCTASYRWFLGGGVGDSGGRGFLLLLHLELARRFIDTSCCRGRTWGERQCVQASEYTLIPSSYHRQVFTSDHSDQEDRIQRHQKYTLIPSSYHRQVFTSDQEGQRIVFTPILISFHTVHH